jgi:5-methylthioribose kinase
MFKLTSDKETIQNYLLQKGFLNSDEAVIAVEIPGAGNMNFTLRITTNSRSFIMKQSRDYVEKYPQVAAPEDRVLRESEFYKIIKKDQDLNTITPDILFVDEESHIIMMEDLGSGSDYTYLYSEGNTLSESELKEIMYFIADLHSRFKSSNTEQKIPNREMRKLNHEHIFKYPFQENNGINLDDILPGLAAVGANVKNDKELKNAVSELGEMYLADGEHLLHGDYFPGSWLKTESGLKIIDPEFCFFGLAEFEIGVCLAHLYMAEQPHSHIKLAMDLYKERAPFNDMLMMKFMSIEMLRRILGLAQLPLSLSLEKRAALVERASMIITKY